MTDSTFVASERLETGVFAVFEEDDDVAYYYLCDATKSRGAQILASIFIASRDDIDFVQADVAIRWNQANSSVGLFIRGKLWAVFHASGQAQGGNYSPQHDPSIPESVATSF